MAEGFAVVCVPTRHKEEFLLSIKKYLTIIQTEFKSVEPGIGFEAVQTETPADVMDQDVQRKLLNAIYTCPNGVIRECDDLDIVETSTNLGIVKSQSGEIQIVTLQRSSIGSAKDDIANAVRSCFELAGALDVQHKDPYPGWHPDPDSAILKIVKQEYEKFFGKMPHVLAVHAGLECGLLGHIYPKMDMISFGPTIKFPHSPDEKVNIASVERFWGFLLEVLKKIPAK